MTEYFAHSPKKGYPAQAYAQHINGVLERVRKYALMTSQYSVSDGELFRALSEIAAVYHDLGKLDERNQVVLSGEKTAKSLPLNHTDAGTAYLLSSSHPSLLPAIAVSSHHKGLPDFVVESIRKDKIFRDESIKDEIDSEVSKYIEIHNNIITDFPQIQSSMPSGGLQVFLRLLLSCLADGDHTDTARHYGEYPAEETNVMLRANERLEKLNQKIESFKLKEGGDSQRFELRNIMYRICRDADIDVNIASCDSPVGSGKTTAVMAHLLNQAAKRGLRRIIIVLPFTNIIEQSVKIYREYLTLPGEEETDVVAELHHRADFQSKEARHLTALWRAPIIVTTAVAFFETLASNKPSTLRRLHELPGSAVFIDESHAALPVKLLPLAWKWILEFAQCWSCYWVMASGSLTRYWEIPEIGGESNSLVVPEIVEDSLRSRLASYENHRISYRYSPEARNLDELAKWIGSFNGPRLVIMNTIQSAAVLAKYLAQTNADKVEHLSTALKASDRRNVLERVRKRLKNANDSDWTLVATSCVEAGVDFSFRNGFRELSSLLSLLQASGRIDREGVYKDSEIWTFMIAEDGKLKRNPGIKESSEVLKYYFENDINISPEKSTDAICREIRQYGMSDISNKMVVHEKTKNFKSVSDEFHVIETDSEIVVVDEKLKEKLNVGAPVDWKEIQNGSVQISKYKLNEYHTPQIINGVYAWNLDYDDFIGYMAGVIQYEHAKQGILVDEYI